MYRESFLTLKKFTLFILRHGKHLPVCFLVTLPEGTLSNNFGSENKY